MDPARMAVWLMDGLGVEAIAGYQNMGRKSSTVTIYSGRSLVIAFFNRGRTQATVAATV